MLLSPGGPIVPDRVEPAALLTAAAISYPLPELVIGVDGLHRIVTGALLYYGEAYRKNNSHRFVPYKAVKLPGLKAQKENEHGK